MNLELLNRLDEMVDSAERSLALVKNITPELQKVSSAAALRQGLRNPDGKLSPFAVKLVKIAGVDLDDFAAVFNLLVPILLEDDEFQRLYSELGLRLIGYSMEIE